MAVTPYMGLTLPTPGTSAPDWAGLLNTALTLLDSHDHTSGHGVQIPSAALNINADTNWNGFNLFQARTVRFQPQASAPSLASDAGCLYLTSAGDLWWNNGAGQHIQLTSGTALAASSLGGISGLGGTSAGAAYSNSTKTFTFSQAANQSALLDAGPLVIHDTAASALGITLQSPAGLAGAYALTFPTALPASSQLLTVSATGQIGFTPTVNALATAKAWANMTIGAAGAVTINKSFNVASASYSGTDLTVNYTTALADGSGAIISSAIGNLPNGVTFVFSQAAATCVMRWTTFAGSGALNWSANAGMVVTVAVFD